MKIVRFESTRDIFVAYICSRNALNSVCTSQHLGMCKVKFESVHSYIQYVYSFGMFVFKVVAVLRKYQLPRDILKLSSDAGLCVRAVCGCEFYQRKTSGCDNNDDNDDDVQVR